MNELTLREIRLKLGVTVREMAEELKTERTLNSLLIRTSMRLNC